MLRQILGITIEIYILSSNLTEPVVASSDASDFAQTLLYMQITDLNHHCSVHCLLPTNMAMQYFPAQVRIYSSGLKENGYRIFSPINLELCADIIFSSA